MTTSTDDYSTVAIFNTSSSSTTARAPSDPISFPPGPRASQDRPHVFRVLVTWMPTWVDNLAASACSCARRAGRRGKPAGCPGPRAPCTSDCSNRPDAPTRSGRCRLLVKYSIPAGGRRHLRLEGGPQPVQSGDDARRGQPSGPRRPHPDDSDATPPADCLSCWTDAYTARPNEDPAERELRRGEQLRADRDGLMSVLFDLKRAHHEG